MTILLCRLVVDTTRSPSCDIQAPLCVSVTKKLCVGGLTSLVLSPPSPVSPLFGKLLSRGFYPPQCTPGPVIYSPCPSNRISLRDSFCLRPKPNGAPGLPPLSPLKPGLQSNASVFQLWEPFRTGIPQGFNGTVRLYD